MSTTVSGQTQDQQPMPAGNDPAAAVRANVLFALGRPYGLNRVEVKRVWGDRYRVNVLVGPDAGSLSVAHSFFVEADAAGVILTSSPPIVRTY